MYIQHALTARSTTGADSGGLGTNTIIFIVVGVACLLAILIGFFLVSRPRGAYNATPNAHGTHPQHSPTTPPPRRKRDIVAHLKIWEVWRHTSDKDPAPTADSLTSQLSPPSVTIATSSPVHHARSGSKTCPSIVMRPSQSRRVTPLSVATSFSHSHITEEALSDFCASAYDLDGDLETEMLHSASARDDVWPSLPLAVDNGCGDVEEGNVARSKATPIVEGSAEGEAPTRPISQRGGGDDYENLGACQRVASSSNAIQGGVSGDHKEAVGQALR